MHNVYIHTYVYICKEFVHYFTVLLLYIATLRAKCAADLDELLEFKVKQYAQGTIIPHNALCYVVITDIQEMEVKSDDYRLFTNLSGYVEHIRTSLKICMN